MAAMGPAPLSRVAAFAAPSALAGASSMGAASGIGFKTGGAQDVSNFRENIKSGKLPIPTDVTYEGLVKDYYFDTRSSDDPKCADLFCPTYSLALAPDPVVAAASKGAAKAAAQPNEVFLAVGLDSGLTNFTRPKLNLVIVLDVSGSMDSSFDEYYYDRFSNGKKRLSEADKSKSKLDVAKEVLQGMLDKLRPDDSVAITLFSSNAATPKKMGKWGSADKEAVQAGVGALKTVSSTNFQAGLDQAVTNMRSYTDCFGGDPSTTENRIIVLTDAQPNEGDITDEGLLARMKANAGDGFYMTMVGIGLDFNTKLVESILKVKGANYYSVHTPGEFKQRLADEFDSMVAPLVFDLSLAVDSSSLAPTKDGSQQGGWKIVNVYGSPDAAGGKPSDGNILKVLTLFPTPKTEEGIKGGVVLLRVQPPPGTTIATAPPLKLSAQYTDRSGKKFTTARTVQVPAAAKSGAAYFQSSGVRKAVALARLSDALQLWLVEENAKQAPASKVTFADRCDIIFNYAGLWTPPPIWPGRVPRIRIGCPLVPFALGRWERQSRGLAVGRDARDALQPVLQFVKSEQAAVKDSTMKQEVDLLQKLVDLKS
ncbi:hypothetical protein MNEG_1821 [Monoraphidium neglectum]|uniref:VWFA domain-containing protein n=1 Tax=Monoraphidium neglectum TaxID=145388 RepID=A0A0D2NNV5_9CHLO|nr:hypothetical protein MNEG_1821 [Monoraphidium neglectum]KIZ06136.1 hypothetical protein MNEG_1821 [Monoraphidium neglectum]|eukprot:XP_013905155.1 hypothetical protein MNEG_1821 [Monoraphidium neglectum]